MVQLFHCGDGAARVAGFEQSAEALAAVQGSPDGLAAQVALITAMVGWFGPRELTAAAKAGHPELDWWRAVFNEAACRVVDRFEEVADEMVGHVLPTEHVIRRKVGDVAPILVAPPSRELIEAFDRLMTRLPDQVGALGMAERFYRAVDPARARLIGLRLVDLDPDLAASHFSGVMVTCDSARMFAPSLEARREAARDYLDLHDRRKKRLPELGLYDHELPDLAGAHWLLGDHDTALRLAAASLAGDGVETGSGKPLGFRSRAANSIFGLAALRRGDVAEAASRLGAMTASFTLPGLSKNVAVRMPDTVLAQGLFEAGEVAGAAAYLRQLGVFLDFDQEDRGHLARCLAEGSFPVISSEGGGSRNWPVWEAK